MLAGLLVMLFLLVTAEEGSLIRQISAAPLSPSPTGGGGDTIDTLLDRLVPYIQRRNGTHWVPIEVDACPTDPFQTVPCILQNMVGDITKLTFFHVVFFYVNRTQPYIDVRVNATTTLVVDMFEPYLDDFPWSLLTTQRWNIVTAWRNTQQLTNITQVFALNYRFPAVPCLTEAVYIFNTLDRQGAWKMWYFGSHSGKICNGSSTTGSAGPGCQTNPDWMPHCLN